MYISKHIDIKTLLNYLKHYSIHLATFFSNDRHLTKIDCRSRNCLSSHYYLLLTEQESAKDDFATD